MTATKINYLPHHLTPQRGKAATITATATATAEKLQNRKTCVPLKWVSTPDGPYTSLDPTAGGYSKVALRFPPELKACRGQRAREKLAFSPSFSLAFRRITKTHFQLRLFLAVIKEITVLRPQQIGPENKLTSYRGALIMIPATQAIISRLFFFCWGFKFK